MPGFFTLPAILGSLVVLGVAQACYYYVYLESPYDYYYRYCNVGCAGMNSTDENFNQCCLPMTSGQTAPAVCATLSASCAAAGTTCTWGSAVPTSAQPSTSAPPASYTPPAYSPRDAPPSTSTVWVTQTTTTPCATPPPTSTAAEECVCDEEEEGTTSAAAMPTQKPPGEGAAPDPASEIVDNEPTGASGRRKRRGFKVRDVCVCPSSSPAPAPSPTAPPPPRPPPPAPSSDKAAVPVSEAPEECVCPPEEGTTSAAAIPTQKAPGEGAAPDPASSIVDNEPTGASGRRKRSGIRARGGECVCPSTSAPPPPPPPTTTPCVCPTSSKAAMPTRPAPGEGALNDGGIEVVDKEPIPRGLEARHTDECVCPPEETGKAGVPTSTSAPPQKPTQPAPGEGAARDESIAMPNQDNRKRSTPNADWAAAHPERRGQEPGENHKRNMNPVQTVTSTTFVTTDDCAQATSAPVPGSTDNAAVPATTTSAKPVPSQPPPGEGETPTAGFVGNDERKRKFRRWSDF